MSQMDRLLSRTLVPLFAAALMLAGCGGSSTPPAEKAADATPPPAAGQPAPEATPDAPADRAAADQDKAAELANKEQELKLREQELALKEKEAQLSKREAELAAQQAAAKKAAAKPAPVKAAAAPVVAKAPPPPPKPLVVPAGTSFSASLVTPLSTKTNRPGDRVEARLASDIVVDGKVAVPAGAIVSGSVTERVSGSKQIGATPKLGIAFDSIAPDPDHVVAISSHIEEVGKSEQGQDVAKIAGGAIAGAIIGHQVSKDKGTIIGGLLGAAAGTAAAKNTGTEVELPAGTVFSLRLDSPVEVKR